MESRVTEHRSFDSFPDAREVVLVPNVGPDERDVDVRIFVSAVEVNAQPKWVVADNGSAYSRAWGQPITLGPRKVSSMIVHVPTLDLVQ